MLDEAELAMVFIVLKRSVGVSKSVLVRHYTDYSPEKLLERYSEGSMNVLKDK